MSDRISKLTVKQKAALDQFKQQVIDITQPHHDDLFLCKWMKARNFDVKKAEVMFRKSMQWRNQIGADTIVDTWTPPEVLEKYYPGGVSGFDKDGNPVCFELTVFMDNKGMYYSAKKTDIIKMEVYQLEQLNQIFESQSVKLGRKVDQTTIIMDMEKLGLKHLWKPGIDIYNEMMTMIEDNYPECLSRCFIINAPRLFPIAYNLVKPFLSEDTKNKIQVLGRNWKSKLLEYIDEDQLPQHWGGTQTGVDGDPYCLDKINMGGDIPESYYRNKKMSDDLDQFTKVTVNRGGVFQLSQDVRYAGSIIRWEYRTENYDIKFGLYLKTSRSQTKVIEMTPILPLERVNSHVVPQDGAVTCQEIGKYVLYFDNTYSWTRSKSLLYNVQVLPPEGNEEMKNDIEKALEDVDLN